jgi:hypothetical protein
MAKLPTEHVLVLSRFQYLHTRQLPRKSVVDYRRDFSSVPDLPKFEKTEAPFPSDPSPLRSFPSERGCSRRGLFGPPVVEKIRSFVVCFGSSFSEKDLFQAIQEPLFKWPPAKDKGAALVDPARHWPPDHRGTVLFPDPSGVADPIPGQY